MADLDFFTLKYKQAERERKVGDRDLRSAGDPGGPLAVAARIRSSGRGRGSQGGTLGRTPCVSWKPQPLMAGLCVS